MENMDFGKDPIPSLFRKMLIPTLLGMVFSAAFVITDGIFVGRGIGSNALAAINVAAPYTFLSIAVGLMFGIGGSVVSSIRLSQKDVKVANIVMTQAFAVSSVILVGVIAVYFLFRPLIINALGASPELYPLVREYLDYAVPFLLPYTIMSVGMFFSRLDGAPRFTMWCMAIATLLNILFDYLFIFVFNGGLMGAALATGTGETVGAVMLVVYLSRYSKTLRPVKLKFTEKGKQFMRRNVWYMSKLGFSGFLNEMAVACMMLVGNYVFNSYLGTDGVAAFSIVCYLTPIIFMIYNSIIQSAQPIISFNYGAGNTSRTYKATRCALISAIAVGCLLFVGALGFRGVVISWFTSPGTDVYDIAVRGIRLFAIGFVPWGINIIAIGYSQSVEKAGYCDSLHIASRCDMDDSLFSAAPVMAWRSRYLAGDSGFGTLDRADGLGDLAKDPGLIPVGVYARINGLYRFSVRIVLSGP